MKKLVYIIACIIFLTACYHHSFAQAADNWNSHELTQPSALAAALKSNKNIPLIFCVGPGAVIQKSINIGMVKNEDNLSKLKDSLSRLPRNADILIYCGCCPFEHCPNVRPAIALLKSMKFTNYHLLNLPNNIKTDWIDKGYPVAE